MSIDKLKSAGHLSLNECLGTNGLVATYKAFHKDTESLSAVVALDSSALANPNAWMRFQTEFHPLVQAGASRLCHARAFGEGQGFVWAAYEYLKGGHLGNLVRDQGLPIAPRSVEIITQTLEAVIALQRFGYPHRLITPASIFVTTDGDVKLLHSAWGGLLLGVHDGPASLNFMSNLPFLSPEVAFGGEGEEASDIYSLGANLFFLLTGQPLHWADSPSALIERMQTVPVDLSPLHQVVPGEVILLIEEMLQPDPEDRPTNLVALHQRMDSLTTALFDWYNQATGANQQQHVSAADEIARQYAAEEQQRQASGVYDPNNPYAAAAPSQLDMANQSTEMNYGQVQQGYDQQAYAPPTQQPSAVASQRSSATQQMFEQNPSAQQPPAYTPPRPSEMYSPPEPGSQGQQEGYQGAPVVAMPAPSSGGGWKTIVIVILVFMFLGVAGVGAIVMMMGGDDEPAATPAVTAPPKNVYAAEQQIQGQYRAALDKLKGLSAFSKKHFGEFGGWPESVDELTAVGAEAKQLLDPWGTKFDARGSFLLSAGPDKRFDNEGEAGDDFWYDCDAGSFGGWEPKASLPEDTPVVGGSNRQVNKAVDGVRDLRKSEIEASGE